MSNGNYYEILGVGPDASMDELEAAFKREAEKYNPSFNPGNEDRFQQILDAYSTLKNPETREQYDANNSIRASANPLRVAFKIPPKAAPEPEKKKTLTDLMDFDWEALDEPDEEEKKAQSRDFTQELAFKLFIIMAFIGIISLIWMFL